MQVAEQAKAGYVGHRASARGPCRGGRGVVERCHRLDRASEHRLVARPALAGGDDRTDAERLGEHEHVAGARARVGDELVGMDDAGDRKAVLGLGIVDRVPTDDRDAGAGRHLGAAAKDLAQDVDAKVLQREREDVHRRQRLPPHRVHV